MRRLLLSVLFSFASILSFAQFQTVGTAVPIAPPGCFRLTSATNNQLGAVWTTSTISFDQPFDIVFEFFLGCNDGGADGMAFVFQNSPAGPSAIGFAGGGLGYQNITPSVSIQMDTYENGGVGDIFEDHISININGSINHLSADNIGGPVPILSTSPNAEDCANHDLRVQWDPTTDSMKVYVDCVLRIAVEYDFLTNAFGGNPDVYWGVTAATGGANNEHRFCLKDLIPNIDTLTICLGDTVPLDAGFGVGYNWLTTFNLVGQGTQVPLVFPDQDTVYRVVVTDTCGIPATKYFIVNLVDPAILDIDLGPDFFLCQGNDTTIDIFRPGVNFEWQDGADDSVYTFSGPGLYWVELTDTLGVCPANRDSLSITPRSAPVANLGNDTTLCIGDTRLLDVPEENATFLWQDNSTDSTFLVSNPGTFFVEVTNACGADSDTIVIDYISPPTVELGNDSTICDSGVLILSLSGDNATYLWQDNSTLSTFIISQTGQYFVTISNQCAVVRDTIDILYDSPPDIDLGNDTSFCFGDSIILDATWTPTSNYLWQNGDSIPMFTVKLSGLYEVIVTNECGFDRTTRDVFVVMPPMDGFFPDTSNLCTGDTLALTTGYPQMDHVWLDNSTDTVFHVTSEGVYYVTVGNECGSADDTTTVIETAAPQVDLGPDLELCEGNEVTLDVQWPDANYLWNDGNTDSVRTFTTTGNFSVVLSNICGAANDAITLDFLQAPEPVDLGSNTTLCDGDTLELDATQDNINPPVLYRWQDGSDEPTFSVRNEGTFSVVVSNDCGESQASVDVERVLVPQAVIRGDSILCLDSAEQVVLDATLPYQVNYLWQNGNGEGILQTNQGGVFSVRVENECGSDTANFEVLEKFCTCEIYVPNAFTPNEDFINDEFYLTANCNILGGTWAVYNRWGERVFETDNLDERWNGQRNNVGALCREGVYVWTYQFDVDAGGLNTTYTRSGTVTLIR